MEVLIFWDEAEIKVIGGKGGNGLVSFRHEMGAPMGGPDGGDGGNGGSVIFEADQNLNTLEVFVRRKVFQANDGKGGERSRCHGKSADDLVLKVPEGTIIHEVNIKWKDKDKTPRENLVADLAKKGERYVAAVGGKGGFGNAHFCSSTRQAPHFAEFGEAGEEKTIKLVLKLIADVGLIGLPNAGKSTLLSVISRAKPKIADYPFTTIVPNLGVVSHSGKSFVAADIPGIIEGASGGKGLGFEFLRHIERTRVIVHLIDVNDSDWVKSYKTINEELKIFSKDLAKKPQIIALNKIETIDEKEFKEKLKTFKAKIRGKNIFSISAATHQGVDGLLYEVIRELEAIKPKEKKEKIKTFTYRDLKKNDFEVKKLKKDFRISGPTIERFAQRTNFSNWGAVERLRDIIKKIGGKKELEKIGIKEGDGLWIGKHRIEW